MRLKERIRRFMQGRYGIVDQYSEFLFIVAILMFAGIFRKRWQKFCSRIKDRRENRIYKCPSCKQRIRVPRGKGKIAITCPQCRTEFIRKS